MRLKAARSVWVLATILTVGTIAGSTSAATRWAQERGDQNQVHDQDYSKNKNYQQGMRDGRDNRSHNRDHSKKRHFKKDEDQRAYEAGYQQGRGDDRSDHH